MYLRYSKKNSKMNLILQISKFKKRYNGKTLYFFSCIAYILCLQLNLIMWYNNKEGVDTNEKFYNMVNCHFWFYVLGI